MSPRAAEHYPHKPVSARITGLLVATLAVLLLNACANSTLVLRPLYNSVDGRIESRVFELATFTDSQTRLINELVGRFHVWHRQYELPQYAALISRLHEQGAARDVQMAEVISWFTDIRARAEKMRACSPLNYAAPVLHSLTDEQIAAIKTGINEQRNSEPEGKKRTPEQRTRARVKQIERTLLVAGFELSAAQKKDLRETMAARQFTPGTWQATREHWDARLFALLAQRKQMDAETFAVRYADYRQQRGQAFDRLNEEQRAADRRRWQEYTLRTVKNLSAQQREDAVAWLKKLASTVAVLARDKPSFEPSSSASRLPASALGCLPA